MGVQDNFNETDESLELENTNLVKEVEPRVRNLIVELLKSGSLVVADNQDDFLLLVKHEPFLKSYLRNLNISFLFNREMGIAYIKNLVREDEDDLPRDEANDEPNAVADKFLISKTMLSPFKAIVILVLRRFYQERFSKGETEIVIDIDHLKNALVPYLNTSVSDRKDANKLNGVLSYLSDIHLIKKNNSEDSDRYTILPLIRYVIDVEKMNEMLKEFEKLNGTVSEDNDDTEEERA